MFSLSSFVVPNEQHVAAKVMDGEAILINLGTGAYYSIPSTGGFIWSLIEKKFSLNEIVRSVAANYDIDRDQAERDVMQLCGELHSEGLVLVSPTGNTETNLPALSTRLAYQIPSLEKFTDMAEMFALDPPLPGLSTVARPQND
jgi:hypothetical protein